MSQVITNLQTLKINYLTQEQYDEALDNGDINQDELYLTPDDGGSGGGVFVAEYGVTTYDAVLAAYEDGQTILVKETVDVDQELYYTYGQLIKYDDISEYFSFSLFNYHVNTSDGAPTCRSYKLTNASGGTWTQNDTRLNTKVTQSAAITTDGEYPVILGYSTATTVVTNSVNKSAYLTYNPSTKTLTNTGAIQCGSIDDGYGLNDSAILSEATMELWGNILS